MATTPSAQQLSVTNLYTALFNRAPDAAGLKFWTQALINGTSLATITQGFLGTPEAAAIYPAAQTSAQFVTSFYQTVFGRAPDAGGLAFWMNSLDAAGGAGSAAAKALVVSQINVIVSTPLGTRPAGLTDAEYAQTVADRSTFSNKAAVGAYFALDTPGTNLSLAKQALAGVTANAASVDAAKLVADGAVAPTVPAAPPAQVLVGTAGNDSFDFTHLTIRAGDSVDGLAGTDTLNYVDSSSTGVTFPAVTVKNVETINIRNVNTANVSTERALLQVLKTMDSGLSFSYAGVTITADGVASITDITQAFITGTNVGNARFSGVLTGYTATLSGASFTLTSTVPGDMPNLVVTGTGSTSVSGFTSNGNNSIVVDTVSGLGFDGATAFNAVLSSAPVAFTQLSAGQSIGMVGNNQMLTGNVSGAYANGAGVATVNLSGGTKSGLVTLGGIGLTGTIVNSTGQANILTGLQLTGATSALTINAATDVNLGTITASGLSAVTVSGAATNVTLGTLANTGLASIVASGLTAGGVTVTLGAALGTSFLGGGGKDTVTIAAGAVMTGALNGGAGTTDTIAFQTGSSLTSATAALISNFEVLQFSAASGTTQTYDPTLIAGTSYQIGTSLGHVVLTNLAAAPSVTVLGLVNGSLSLVLANATGTTDVVDVALDNVVNRAAGFYTGTTLTELKAVGVETVKIHALGTVIAGSDGTSAHSVMNSTANTSLKSIVIDGSQAIQINTGTLVGSVALTIDATTATGAVTVTARDATLRVDVNGGTASDTILAGQAGGTIFGGIGGDLIRLLAGSETLVYKSGADSLLDTVNTAGTSAAKMDAISGFQSGTDKIDLTALVMSIGGQQSYLDKNFATVADLAAANGSASFYTVGPDTRKIIAAHIGSDTYLVVDTNGNNTFNVGTDLVIKLTGTATVQESDLVLMPAG